MSRETLGAVRDGSRDNPGDPGRVRGPSRRSGRVGVPTHKSGTGRGTLLVVRDKSSDPPRGTSRGSLPEVRVWSVWDWTGYTRGGSG